MYPIAESFRLCIQVMSLPQFPFNVLGNARGRGNKTEVFCAIAPDDKLVYRCSLDPLVRVNDQGDMEADLISEASRQGE